MAEIKYNKKRDVRQNVKLKLYKIKRKCIGLEPHIHNIPFLFRFCLIFYCATKLYFLSGVIKIKQNELESR